MHHHYRLLLAALVFCLAPLVAQADDDRDELSEAARHGPLKPLDEILASVSDRIDGRVADIEFEKDHGRAIYEIYWIDGSGRRRELHVDAHSGEVVGKREDD